MNSSRCSIRETQHGPFDALILENSLFQLTIVPQLGGRIISLIRMESGYEYILQPFDPARPHRIRSYAAKFQDDDASGFDECIPTVAECHYSEQPFLGRQLPDHGDVWSLPSAATIVGAQINLTTDLRSLPLRFTKKLQLRGNVVRLEYVATNLSPSNVRFLWSAHPLLRVEPGAEIILPGEVKEIEVGWSKDERMGKPGDRCTWPKATDCSGRMLELNHVVSPEAETAEKFFTPRLSEGFCAMFLPQVNEAIVFRFDSQLVPYVGLWICQGGWPTGRAEKHFTVALEPCIGRPDSLEQAIRRNECALLRGHETMQWWMEIQAGGGPPQSLWM